jgi:hypothetical protein
LEVPNRILLAGVPPSDGRVIPSQYVYVNYSGIQFHLTLMTFLHSATVRVPSHLSMRGHSRKTKTTPMIRSCKLLRVPHSSWFYPTSAIFILRVWGSLITIAIHVEMTSHASHIAFSHDSQCWRTFSFSISWHFSTKTTSLLYEHFTMKRIWPLAFTVIPHLSLRNSPYSWEHWKANAERNRLITLQTFMRMVIREITSLPYQIQRHWNG